MGNAMKKSVVWKQTVGPRAGKWAMRTPRGKTFYYKHWEAAVGDGVAMTKSYGRWKKWLAG